MLTVQTKSDAKAADFSPALWKQGQWNGPIIDYFSPPGLSSLWEFLPTLGLLGLGVATPEKEP